MRRKNKNETAQNEITEEVKLQEEEKIQAEESNEKVKVEQDSGEKVKVEQDPGKQEESEPNLSEGAKTGGSDKTEDQQREASDVKNAESTGKDSEEQDKKAAKRKKRGRGLLTVFLLLVFIFMAGSCYWMWNQFQLAMVQEECNHFFENGECIYCKMRCNHELWKNGVCTTCGMKCEHTWQSGRCINCGYLCEHERNINGVCAVCGYACKHIKFQSGICVNCGYQCPHDWRNGICAICKSRCRHEDHDKDTQVCFTCGRKVTHKYVDGICSCGKVPSFVEDWVSKDMYTPCENGGKVETITYDAPCYDGSFQGAIQKEMDIYLPFNYDPNAHYDVLVMYHGGFDNCHSWTTNWYSVQYVNVNLKNMYDNMIDKKLCNPLIIVSPSTWIMVDGKQQDVSIEQNAGELVNIILPYVAEHYATYARNGTAEALKAARDHFGVGGCSNGSLFAYNCGFLANFEYFSNFACMSGDNCSAEIAESINSGTRKILGIACYYCGAGETDSQRNRTKNGFDLIVGETGRLEEGTNAYFKLIKSSHDWKTFSLSLYNALQVLFPHTPLQ